MKYLKALSIAVPPLAEQHTIATKIVKCEETIAKAEAQIAKVAVKKSAILKMYL